MVIGVICAGLVLGAGLVVGRALRLPYSLAPTTGLATIAIATVWCDSLGAPPGMASAVLLTFAVLSLRLVRPRRAGWSAPHLAILGGACLLPLLLLGAAFVGVEAPLSTHDGAFHVETVDALRRGLHLQTWYPIGFHATAAAVLGLVPWLDSALGSSQVALGLAIVAPLAVFGLARGFDLPPLVACTAAVIIGLTWIYPYDYHLWAGWPQGMGVLLALGVWTTSLAWLHAPRTRYAIVVGLLAAGIVLTHGIDVYSAAVGVLVLAAVGWRRIPPGRLVAHGAISLVVAALASAPYLPTLLGWAGVGGATDAGAQAAEQITSADAADWLLQNAAGITGAATPVDLPLRVLLVGLGIAAAWRGQRAVFLAWVLFAVLSLAEVAGSAPGRWLYVVTYPWLSDQRPREIAVILASILSAAGLATAWAHLRALRLNPNAARRAAIAFVLTVGFFAEGTGVSIYKRLVANVALQDSFTADDGAAMSWLKSNAPAGSLVVNDGTSDAGIWAPYKTDLPILLPRSASGDERAAREPILDHMLDLNGDPLVQQQACALNADYVYSGARALSFESRSLPDRRALQRAPYLKEVFSSGEAAVFEIELPCAEGHGGSNR